MTIQDLKTLIADTIKVNPNATDKDKLQGYRHVILLNAIVDFFAAGAGAGDFPFDWSQPSNAFSGYSNTEQTFKAGFYKFLHRASAPVLTLAADDAVRERGASAAVTLHYALQAGSSAITQLVVDTLVFANPSQYVGTVATATAPNTSTHFTASASDANGLSATAGANVRYLDRRVALTVAGYLENKSDADISAVVRSAGGELADSRYFTATVKCTNSKLYVAYPVAFGDATKIFLNGFEDTSFSKKYFSHTNSSGFTQQYILYISANKLFGDNKIEIK